MWSFVAQLPLGDPDPILRIGPDLALFRKSEKKVGFCHVIGPIYVSFQQRHALQLPQIRMQHQANMFAVWDCFSLENIDRQIATSNSATELVLIQFYSCTFVQYFGAARSAPALFMGKKVQRNLFMEEVHFYVTKHNKMFK